MNTIRIDLNNDHSVGLGDNLCLLSVLANIPPKIDLYVSNAYNTFDKLTQYKKIFRIPNSQLEIFESDVSGDYNNVGWPTKLFVEYYRPIFINLKGKILRTDNPKQRPAIGLVPSIDPVGQDLDRWPWTRSRPQEYWDRLSEWIKSIGYNVIMLEDPYHDLEDKMRLMVDECTAVIGYEGGMGHLSHMLSVPYFMVDWRRPSPDTPLGHLHCDFVHKSKSVYILRKDEELFSWNRENFDSKVLDLKQGKTNNLFVSGECCLKFEGPGIYGEMSVYKGDLPFLYKISGLYGIRNKFSELLNTYYGN